MSAVRDQPCADVVSGACGDAYVTIRGEVVHCTKTFGHEGEHLGRGKRAGSSWLLSWPNTADLTKENAPCCRARALPDGRLPLGYCSPGCVRRPAPPQGESR